MVLSVCSPIYPADITHFYNRGYKLLNGFGRWQVHCNDAMLGNLQVSEA
jgi:hypothetical protein